MDVDSLWTSILGEIELEISKANFAAFFKGTKIKNGPQENVIEVFCPNPASSLMLKNRFYFLIKSYLEKRLNKNIFLKFSVSPQKNTFEEESSPLFSSAPSFEDRLRKTGLNPNYTFENFAVSETNQMAHAAAQAVSNKPAKAYNPLFIWGSTGVGKTHLIQALGRHALSKKQQLNVVYCTGEDFTNGIIEAITKKSTSSFKKKYRNLNILLVDDIQFIAGREAVQMEFFHTFNSIVHLGGQIVLTSDKPPREIKKLEARLRSRFEGGLIVDVSNPNFELRTAIILIKAQERGINLPIEIAKNLSANFDDVRALEGALLRYVSEKSAGTESDKIVSKIVNIPTEEKEERKKSTNPNKIIELVSSHFGLKTAQIKGVKRKKQVAQPRQLLMYVLRQDLGLPFAEIGVFLGGRDHTTIMHGVDRISSLLPKKEKLRQDLIEIRRFLWG